MKGKQLTVKEIKNSPIFTKVIVEDFTRGTAQLCVIGYTEDCEHVTIDNTGARRIVVDDHRIGYFEDIETLCKDGMHKPTSARPRGTDAAQLITIIETKSLRGTGVTESDPCREVIQYWDLDGNLLAEKDPYERS
jgi:hypothetical protein